MWQITNILQQINSILAKARTADEEAKARGEKFNIFSIIGVNHYETTHSAIIAEFLNPQGSHCQGNLFLEEFFVSCRFSPAKLMKSKNPFDITTAKVYTEYDTGNGRIDILIKNDSGQAIIIENKLYAADQPEQLKRYADYAENQKWDYSIVYLTLYGNKASNQSADGVDYVCISYCNEIIRWLQRCTRDTVNKPFLRESFIQYSNLIKKLTHQDMETKYSEEIIKTMIDNSDAVAAICNAQPAYRIYVINNILIPKLKKFADKADLQFGCMLDQNVEKGFYFKKKEWKDAAVWYYSESRILFSGFYIAVMNENIEVQLNIGRTVQLPCFDGKCTDAYPFGWKYMEHGYSDWNMDTVADMVSGKFIDYVEKETLTIIEEIQKVGGNL